MHVSLRGHRRRPLIMGSVAALGLGILVVVPGQAAIAPSTFDGLNGNVSTTGSGLTDWEDLTLSNNGVADGKFVYQNDEESGQGDDSFTQGTDENTEPPVPGTGSVPPNKSDLTRFYLGTEKAGPANKQFLYLAWARVLDPNGTTNMDFEFNQASDGISTNGVTPNRMHGDVLVEYKLSKGGTVPSIFMYRWLTVDGAEIQGFPTTCEAGSRPCWSSKRDLTATGIAEGSVNQVTITDDLVSPPVPRTPFTFGEASIDLSGAGLFTAGQCTTFGKAYLKSRSSDSFTAALKDYIAPLTINLTNCGKVTVVKQTNPDQSTEQTKASFSFGVSPAAGNPSVSTFDLTDADSTPVSGEGGVKEITNVAPGQYTISETVPTGWAPEQAPSCTGGNPQYGQNNDSATITVAASSDITCTFYNILKPRLTLVKTITNDNGGSAAASAWTLTANGTGNNDISGVTGSTAVTSAVVDADTFALSESGGPSGYTPGSWSCVKNGGQAVTGSSVTLVNGDVATCTINNDDSRQGPVPISTVQTWVLHDSAQVTGLRAGGGSASFTFELYTDSLCTAGNEVEVNGTDYKETRSATFNAAGTTASAATSTGALVSASGYYYWKVVFSGNSYNDGNSSCAEVTQIRAKDDLGANGRDDFTP